jgi:hypothetical protein
MWRDGGAMQERVAGEGKIGGLEGLGKLRGG